MADTQAGESSKDLLMGVAQKIGSTLGAVAATTESVAKNVTAKVASALQTKAARPRKKATARHQSSPATRRRRSALSSKASRRATPSTRPSNRGTRVRARKPSSRRSK